MTPETKAKLIEVLRAEDAPKEFIRQRFLSLNGLSFCAIGYLAHKAGVSTEDLADATGFSIDDDYDHFDDDEGINQALDALYKMRSALEVTYGLSVEDAFLIQRYNDDINISPMTPGAVADFIESYEGGEPSEA